MEANKVGLSDYGADQAGFVIQSAVHMPWGIACLDCRLCPQCVLVPVLFAAVLLAR